MTKNKKPEADKLAEFFNEVENQEKIKKESNPNNEPVKQSTQLSKPYQCPSCHRLLSSRKEPCKYCGYKGYIPMGDEEIKRTRTVLFIVILIIAIAVYVLMRT